ncbi:PINIT domain-containing protein [Lipomyces oligophaga]|uniref:PINIT domain-containing protein n=1 Tax=Lipomyces oligophaga TaxID=45792 RepID=UPI0034CE667E
MSGYNRFSLAAVHGSEPSSEVEDLISIIFNDLTLPPLRSICSQLNISRNGRKSAVQQRIIDQLQLLRNQHASESIAEIREIIYNARDGRYSDNYTSPSRDSHSSAIQSTSSTSRTSVPNPASLPAYQMVSHNAHSASNPHTYRTNDTRPPSALGTLYSLSKSSDLNVMTSDRAQFLSTPFYIILNLINTAFSLKPLPQAKNHIRLPLQLSSAQVDRLKTDHSYRVFLLSKPGCASSVSSYLQFPHYFEVRINDNALPFNLRGLKGKPWTVNPADLTEYIDKSRIPPYIDIHYAYTNSEFTIGLFWVRKRSVPEIATSIVSGRHLAKETVMAEIMKKNSDDEDIITGASIITLKCPLSFCRITLPIRSVKCSHVQCYDAYSYLELQEQAPTWTCPVCNNPAPMEDIVVDSYFEDILKRTRSDIESVEIDPDGTWRVPEQTADLDLSDSDSDIGQEGNPRDKDVAHKTLDIDMELPHEPNQERRSNVIDLTLSDDDEPTVLAQSNVSDQTVAPSQRVRDNALVITFDPRGYTEPANSSYPENFYEEPRQATDLDHENYGGQISDILALHDYIEGDVGEVERTPPVDINLSPVSILDGQVESLPRPSETGSPTEIHPLLGSGEEPSRGTVRERSEEFEIEQPRPAKRVNNSLAEVERPYRYVVSGVAGDIHTSNLPNDPIAPLAEEAPGPITEYDIPLTSEVSSETTEEELPTRFSEIREQERAPEPRPEVEQELELGRINSETTNTNPLNGYVDESNK